MTSSEFNPFLKARLIRPDASGAVSPAGQNWLGGYNPSAGNLSTDFPLSMFQMSEERGQEGFRPSSLDFVPDIKSVPSSLPVSSSLSFDGTTNKRPQESHIPVNLAKSADASESQGLNKIVVLDHGKHGDTVTKILGNAVGQDNVIQVDDPVPEAPFTNLNDFLEKGMTMALADKTKDINDVIKRHNSSPMALAASEGDGADAASPVGIINVSSGFSKAALVNTLLQTMQNDPVAGRSILKDLGLQSDATPDDIVTSLVVRLENISDGNPHLEEAKGQYQAAVNSAKKHNIAVVVAAGNEHDTYRTLDRSFKAKFGNDFNLIDAVPDISTNLYSMADGVTTVGAIDDKGTPSIHDDTAAPFSSRSDRVTIAANGVNVPVEGNVSMDGGTTFSMPMNAGVNGTSFSAPEVSATYALIQQQNPGLSVDEQTRIITGTAKKNGKIGKRVEGSGELDAEAALKLAQQVSEI